MTYLRLLPFALPECRERKEKEVKISPSSPSFTERGSGGLFCDGNQITQIIIDYGGGGGGSRSNKWERYMREHVWELRVDSFT